jgi:hypothetical protein
MNYLHCHRDIFIEQQMKVISCSTLFPLTSEIIYQQQYPSDVPTVGFNLFRIT